MRTAIVLLFLLALAAVPGSLLPQRSLSQNKVSAYFTDHPTLAPVPGPALPVRRLQLAVVRRGLPAAVHLADRLRAAAGAGARPRAAGRAAAGPAAPAAAARLRRRCTTPLAGAGGARRRRGGAAGPPLPGGPPRRPAGPELSAEKGYLKETGNLLFHLSLVALLLGLAGGKLWGYEGSILVTEGQGFCNSFQQYDTYSSGPLVDERRPHPAVHRPGRLPAPQYEPNLTASSFTADISYGAPGGRRGRRRSAVNHPLRVDGDRVYVTGHGFSPDVHASRRPTARRSRDVSVPFLPTDQSTMASEGALKLPDLGAGERRPAGARGLLRADRRGAEQDPHLGRPAAAGPAGRDLRLPGLPGPGLRHPAVGVLAGPEPDRPRPADPASARRT